MPRVMQTAGWWTRPTGFLDRCRRRFGKRFTVRLAAQDPFIVISDPEELKQVFTAPPDVLHPGEGTRILEPIVGPNSILLLDEGAHMSQRKLVLPAFHGERMRGLESMIAEVAREQMQGWPRGHSVPIHPRMQSLTLEVILAAVFGLRGHPRLDDLRVALTEMLDFGMNPLSLLPPARRAPFGRGPWGRFLRVRARADELIYAEINDRREQGDQGGSEIINSLIAARHEDGSPMADVEIHDELMTLLVAGHETTATALSWAFELMFRRPDALERAQEEARAGDETTWIDAVIEEALRLRPVVPFVGRELRRPMTLGGNELPTRTSVFPGIYLAHTNPEAFPDPYAFRPERFLADPPETYSWIPFGGGTRRCIGAAFAQFEMRIVLQEVLRRAVLRPASPEPQPMVRRNVTLSPRDGTPAVLADWCRREPRLRVIRQANAGCGAARNTAMRAAARPRFRSCAWKTSGARDFRPATTSAVPSVEPSSTRTIS